MTARGEEQTLKEIYNLLKDRVLSYTRHNDNVMIENDRMKDTLQKTARSLSSSSNATTGPPRPFSADNKQMSEEFSKLQEVNKILEARHLSDSRKLAKTETELSKVNDKLQQLQKSLVGILDSDKACDNTVLDLLLEVRSSVNECRQGQTHTDRLVEKISFGVQQLLENQQNVAQGNQELKIPAELNFYCSKMQAQGKDFRILGEALNIEATVLQKINQRYDDDEEDQKFHQVIREWAKKPTDVHIRDFVGACHTANGKAGKDQPLAPEERDKLLQNVSYLCDNMLDVPLVLPHLVSKSVISPRLSEYVLAPSGRIERILRLVDILCTKKSGYEEFYTALKVSDQAHVAENMIEGGDPVVPSCGKRSASFSGADEERVGKRSTSFSGADEERGGKRSASFSGGDEERGGKRSASFSGADEERGGKRSASFSGAAEKREEDAQSTMSEDVMAPGHDILRQIAALLQEHGILNCKQ